VHWKWYLLSAVMSDDLLRSPTPFHMGHRDQGCLLTYSWFREWKWVLRGCGYQVGRYQMTLFPWFDAGPSLGMALQGHMRQLPSGQAALRATVLKHPMLALSCISLSWHATTQNIRVNYVPDSTRHQHIHLCHTHTSTLVHHMQLAKRHTAHYRALLSIWLSTIEKHKETHACLRQTWNHFEWRRWAKATRQGCLGTTPLSALAEKETWRRIRHKVFLMLQIR
jgi:hypothetical protein